MAEIRTTHLQLPLHFDAELLLADLQTALGESWTPHFNTNGYKGGWKSVALLSPNGNAQHIFVHHDDLVLEETTILKNCPYFQQVLQQFDCPVVSARLLNLEVGAEILPHSDHELGYEDGTFRLHIPITTNKDVEFIVNDEALRMLSGECWYTNVNYIHSVANRGTSDRVHLVIDCTRNDWTDALFFSLAPEESFAPPPPEPLSDATKKQMLEELMRINSPAAQALIEGLRSELKASEK